MTTNTRTARPLHLPLAAAADRAKRMRQPTVVVLPSNQEKQLKARVAELEARLRKAEAAAAERAQRLARVEAVTLHVTDNRASWAAKMGTRRQPVVALTSTSIHTADVWLIPQEDDT